VIYLNVLARGAVIWLVPFLVSFSFYTPSGELTTSYALFKSAMVLTLTWTTLAMNLVRPPRGLPPWLVAAAYLLINVVLDVLVLVPLMGLTAIAYVEQIGLVYLLIPSLTLVLLRRPGGSGANTGQAPASSLTRG
jgi:hypothetical protein